MQSRPSKPDGVTILGISAVLTSMTLLFAGTALALGVGSASAGPEAAGLLIAIAFGYYAVGALLITYGVGTLLATAFAAMLLILAIVYLATGIGFFWRRLWAWFLGVALSVIGIVLSLIQIGAWSDGLYFSWPGLLISLLILFYLRRSYVRDFFAKKTSAKTSIIIDLRQTSCRQTK